jgi:hypothetical protein
MASWSRPSRRRSVPFDEIARLRFDADEIDEPEILIALSQRMSAPAEDLAEYRHRFTRERRAVVRRRLQELVTGVDDLPGALPPAPEDNEELPGWSEAFDWEYLRPCSLRARSSARARRSSASARPSPRTEAPGRPPVAADNLFGAPSVCWVRSGIDPVGSETPEDEGTVTAMPHTNR